MTDRHQTTAYPLRLPADLKEGVTRAAVVAGRSFNAEVASRLKASFDESPRLPGVVQDAVDEEVTARGGTSEDALARLVLLGQSKGGTVFQLTIAPGMTMREISAALEAAKVVIPPDADLMVDRL